MGELIKAVKDKQYDQVKELLERGADPNDRFPPPGHMTALMAASLQGDLEMMRLLLAKGADIQLHNDHYRAIHGACIQGHLEAVKLLLQSGANIEDPAPDKGGTPLGWAVSMNQLHVIEYLLEQGAKVHPGLLRWAIKMNKDPSVEILKKHVAKGDGFKASDH